MQYTFLLPLNKIITIKESLLKKQLSKQGNSWILHINKTLTEFLKITPYNRNVILIIKKTKLFVIPNQENKNIQKECYCIKKIINHGSGYGLVFSQSLLELLDISPKADLLEIVMDENKLIITKSS